MLETPNPAEGSPHDRQVPRHSPEEYFGDRSSKAVGALVWMLIGLLALAALVMAIFAAVLS